MYGCKGEHRCECASNGIIMSRTVFCTNLSSVPGLSCGPLADTASSRPLEAEIRDDPGRSHNRLLRREGRGNMGARGHTGVSVQAME